MNLRAAPRLLLLLVLAGVLSGGTCSWTYTSDDNRHDNGTSGSGTTQADSTSFSGGALASQLTGVPGVLHAEAGWDGDGPFFGAWLAWLTGHHRVTQVQFDPAQLSLAGLLTEVRARSTRPFVVMLAHSAQQAGAARAAWPPGEQVQLVVRRARTFTTAD